MRVIGKNGVVTVDVGGVTVKNTLIRREQVFAWEQIDYATIEPGTEDTDPKLFIVDKANAPSRDSVLDFDACDELDWIIVIPHGAERAFWKLVKLVNQTVTGSRLSSGSLGSCSASHPAPANLSGKQANNENHKRVV